MKIQSIIILSILLFSFANAQEIGVAPVKFWTNNYEIQNPIGIGFSISKTIWNIRLKVEYLHAKNERTYYGFISYGFMTYPLPDIENVSSTSSISTYEFSISFPFFFRLSDIGLNLGFGYSFDTFSADRTGMTTGKKVSFGNVLKTGPFLISSIDFTLFSPLIFELNFKRKGLFEGPSVTDAELPFVDNITVYELQLSILYKLN